MAPPKTTLQAARLALFAMLLIVVAPLISITLQNAASSPVPAMPGMMMHHDMSAMADMPEMGLHHVMPSHAPSDTQSTHIDHAEACGYCVLLTHVPGLILLVALLIFGWLRQRVVKRPRFIEPLWLFTPWSRPHSRGPPTLTFL